MLVIWLAVIVVFLYVLYSFITSTRVKYRLPGPAGWPIVGCIFQIDPNRLHVSLDEWAKKYGPLILCRMATTNMVVISCPRMVKKAFMAKGYSDVLNDRPDTFFAKYIMNDSQGIIFGKYGQTLIRLRKIMYKGLKMYGEGVQQFENMAHKELEMLMKSISDLGGRDFDPKELLSRSLANLIAIILTGSMADEADAHLIWRYNNNNNEAALLATDVMLGTFPFLRFMPVEVGRIYRRTENAKKALLEKYFVSYKETYEPGRERGLVDVLLKLQVQENREGETQWLTDSQVKAFILDIVAAGLNTTRNGLLGIVLVLLHHTDCLDAIYQEIVTVVGIDRYPSLKDRPAMHYTEAAILEALRCITQVPLTVPHCAMEELEFEGYTIPRLAMVIANLWAIHHDPAIWGDPWKFRPERFLDDNGKLLPVEHTLRQSLLNFGIGKRICVGENLARSRLFLYLTTLIQKFDLIPAEVGNLPSDDSRTFLPGITLRPQDYKMRAIAR